ncbi:MAG: adenylosuccinate lyase [Nitrososphaerota archaeon]|nr:adenylosuccinate lyase [Nitrososphaerota archaeon]
MVDELPIFFGHLFGGAYSTDEMNKIWSERNFVQKILDIEAALAKAQAELGIIPKWAAEEIINAVNRGFPPEEIAKVKSKAKHIMVSTIYAFQEKLGEAGEYFHLGPTTQDILDTSLTLMMIDSLKVIISSLREFEKALIEQAVKYKDAVMAGRTHGQHAVPITFGLKLAIWATEVREHIERLKSVLDRIGYISLSGAVGTMASFVAIVGYDEGKVFEMLERTAKYLGLKAPHIDLHQRMDRFAEVVSVMSLVSSSLGKIGLEIRDLSREEVKEVFEPWVMGIHGSSTMPQKRNPEPSEWLEGIAKIVRVFPVSMNSVTMQHERDATRTASQFLVLPLTFMLTHAQIKSAIRIIGGLQVFTKRMLENMMVSKGFMAAEPVMLKLAERTGKKVTAHKIIYEVSQKAIEEGKSFKEVLLESEEVMKYLSKADIEKLLELERYIGTSIRQIEKIVNDIKAKRDEEEKK